MRQEQVPSEAGQQKRTAPKPAAASTLKAAARAAAEAVQAKPKAAPAFCSGIYLVSLGPCAQIPELVLDLVLPGANQPIICTCRTAALVLRVRCVLILDQVGSTSSA